jgi:hypothetical protein
MLRPDVQRKNGESMVTSVLTHGLDTPRELGGILSHVDLLYIKPRAQLGASHGTSENRRQCLVKHEVIRSTILLKKYNRRIRLLLLSVSGDVDDTLDCGPPRPASSVVANIESWTDLILRMASGPFLISEHKFPCQYIWEYPHATANSQESTLHLAVKRYKPLANQQSLSSGEQLSPPLPMECQRKFTSPSRKTFSALVCEQKLLSAASG